jgi:hypothetical protein
MGGFEHHIVVPGPRGLPSLRLVAATAAIAAATDGGAAAALCRPLRCDRLFAAELDDLRALAA